MGSHNYFHNYIALTSSEQLSIASFTRTSGLVGTQVTITASNFTGTTDVAFNGTAATSFTVDLNTQINANVTAAAVNQSATNLFPAGYQLEQNYPRNQTHDGNKDRSPDCRSDKCRVRKKTASRGFEAAT